MSPSSLTLEHWNIGNINIEKCFHNSCNFCMIVFSREWAGSDLGNPEFPFLNLHFAFLAAGRTLGIVDAEPIKIIVF